MTTIAVIPDNTVDLEKGLYNGVYVMKYFTKEGVVDRKEEQVEMVPDPDEEEMKDVRLDGKIERHWRMVFEDNDGEVEDEK